MPIHRTTWLGRLTQTVPGWYFWYHDDGLSAGKPWHAVPAPPKTRIRNPGAQPGRVDAATPQQLRTECQRRRGWAAGVKMLAWAAPTWHVVTALVADLADRADLVA